jgi:sugar/nucleoside kinase (ribokinase family)
VYGSSAYDDAVTPAVSLWDVVGIGANSVDFVNLLPAVPQPHGPHAKMRIRRQIISCGGQMTTAMACCARLGLRAKYVGVTGTDENGRRIRAEMSHHQVDMADAVIRDVPNQFAVIIVDETTGERIVLWDRDERLQLRPREIPLDALRAARLMHVDDVDQAAAIEAAKLGRQAGIRVTSDIDRLTDRTEELVSAVTIPIFAEHVPVALTGKPDPESALRALRQRHDGLLCVTLGHQGALALDGDRAIHSPAFPVNAVDTTGAGDVFRSGFIYGTLQGWPIEQVLRFANAAAGVSCTRLGALAGIPSLPDVERLLGATH